MKKILFGLFCSFLIAQGAAAQSCVAQLGNTFTPAQEASLCRSFGTAVSNSLVPRADATFDVGSSTRTWRDLFLGRNVITTATAAVISPNTVDAADSKSICIAGGGDCSGATRGAKIIVRGNESSSGGLLLDSGDASAGVFIRSFGGEVNVAPGGTLKWQFQSNGNLVSDATLGADLVFLGSGDTISIQEGTAASACMGVATPAGNTPVAVSTTCAVANSRVFYTRVGAVTNMATISTTTAPSGTGFSFASVGASDTTASSVVWMIVKESA